MTELDPRLQRALAQIGDAWSPDRSERNLAGTRLRHRTSRRRRALGGAAGLGALLGAAWVVWSPAQEPERTAVNAAHVPPPAAAAPARHMQFEDGSQLELLDPASQVVVDEVTRERVAVRLLDGRVRVDVVPRKERSFRVQCGLVTVEVLGTAFELTREGERTRVEVLRGRVAVHAPDGSHELSAGEAGWFPRASRTRAKVDPAPQRQRSAAKQAPDTAWQPQEEAGSHRQRTAAKQQAPDTAWQPQEEAASHRQRTAAKQAAPAPDEGWQAQAERGNFEQAFELMPRTPEPVSNDVEALLLAADAARLSGHPAQALPFLRQVTERHPRDPRASLAAFTLGGVLLNQLDRPREAEAAYALARRLALRPALAQDALARQVEAAHRAGDSARMRELATEYLRRYPDGRRVKWVRDTSGL